MEPIVIATKYSTSSKPGNYNNELASNYGGNGIIYATSLDASLRKLQTGATGGTPRYYLRVDAQPIPRSVVYSNT